MSLNSKIFDLPSIKETLIKNNIYPKKSLGQNFILDLNVTNKIAKSISCYQKNIIEVGPGPGCLTRSVLNDGANSVLAIEKDIKMIECLSDLKIYEDIKWPKFDKSALEKEEVNFVIQINSKKRHILKLKKDILESDLLEFVKKDKIMEKYLNNKAIKKVIFVKNRLMNILLDE